MYYDPDTNIPFYIGKGCNNRYRDVGSRSYNKYLYNKIQKLRNIKGYKVLDFTKFLLENLTNEEALTHEIRLIEEIGRKHLNKGPLLNLTEGGDGVACPPNKILKIIEDTENFKRMVSNRQTIKQLAKFYNCGTSTITRAAKKIGINFVRDKKQLPELEIINQYKKEKSLINLATKYNCNRDVIIRILKTNNIKIEDGRAVSPFRGGKISKTEDPKSNMVMQMFYDNIHLLKIARTLHIDINRVRNIIKTVMPNYDGRTKQFRRI